MRIVALVAALTVVLSTMVVFVHPHAASATVDDGFAVASLSNKCFEGGLATYVDYGEGLPGGGKNDDYITITDECKDNHGVKAWAWLNGTCLEGCHGVYNGSGAGKVTLVWDPFPNGNVREGDSVGLKICSVDGDTDPTPTGCDSGTIWSVDG
jgi:hypothetical protein